MSGKKLNQIPHNFKSGDMSVVTNDLKGTPNGIIRLQDVKFGPAAAQLKTHYSNSNVVSASNSAYEKTENTS